MLNYPSENNKLPFAFDAWKLIQNEKAELIRISLKPGEFIEPHKNDHPVIFFCISGKANISANGVTMILEKGGAVYIEPGNTRGFRNDGTEGLEVAVFKVKI